MTQRTERNKNHEEPMTKENQKIVSTKLELFTATLYTDDRAVNQYSTLLAYQPRLHGL